MRQARAVIVDTSGLRVLLDKTDPEHARATQMHLFISTAHKPIIVPSPVLGQTAEGLRIVSHLDRPDAVALVRAFTCSDAVTVVHPTDALHEKALTLFTSKTAVGLYTDCLVMAYAKQYSTTEILGFDPVFADFGYHLPATTTKI